MSTDLIGREVTFKGENAGYRGFIVELGVDSGFNLGIYDPSGQGRLRMLSGVPRELFVLHRHRDVPDGYQAIDFHSQDMSQLLFSMRLDVEGQQVIQRYAKARSCSQEDALMGIMREQIMLLEGRIAGDLPAATVGAPDSGAPDASDG